MGLNDQLHGLSYSLTFVVPELILIAGLCLVLLTGLIFRRDQFVLLQSATLLLCVLSIGSVLMGWPNRSEPLFFGMLRFDDYSSYWKLLFDLGGVLAAILTQRNRVQKQAEYFLLLLTIVLGAHLLVMSMNFIMVILSLELLSISSYALAGWNFTREGTEGSLKYFLFGSVATATMVYGISLMYGLAGTLDFSSEHFIKQLIEVRSPLLWVGGLLTMAGFLFKMGSAPMHFWVPDVYQSAPTPVVAFLSVVPKLAGMAALIKFVVAIMVFRQSPVDWTMPLALIAALSITVGNFSALWQTSPKRMLAYSSIAQAGFLLIGIVPVNETGMHASLFYGAVLLVMNFLTFHTLQQFERDGVSTIASFAGLGKRGEWRSMGLTTGLISLIGLPVTAGFTAKLFIFSGLWESYNDTHRPALIALLIFGLLNTVVSLFYYLRIPYYLFLKESPAGGTQPAKIPLAENLLSILLVMLLLVLFFRPDLLMGWIIRVNFVL